MDIVSLQSRNQMEEVLQLCEALSWYICSIAPTSISNHDHIAFSSTTLNFQVLRIEVSPCPVSQAPSMTTVPQGVRSLR